MLDSRLNYKALASSHGLSLNSAAQKTDQDTRWPPRSQLEAVATLLHLAEDHTSAKALEGIPELKLKL
eukprot:3771665-Amphidinium_carterae.1